MQDHEHSTCQTGGEINPANGFNPIEESLSALMDGETQPLELQRLLKSAAEEDALRATWARYQMTSALIRKQSVDNASVTLAFADRIQRALAQESVIAASGDNRPLWAKFAVAASVAIAVVAGVQWQQQLDASAQPLMAQTSEATRVMAGSGERPAADSQQVATDKMPAQVFMASQPTTRNTHSQQVQFEHYMQYHLERASLNEGRGMVPLSRKVSVEER